MFEDSHKITRRGFLGQLATMGVFFVIGSSPKAALANIPTVALDGRKLNGNEFEVTVQVFHKGNSMFHYVNQVVLYADGEEAKAWNYSWNKRPESENFSVKAKLGVTQKTVFSAMANCNLHGENKDKGNILLSP
jgi:desulfoferrodoxin (superoxide reductase-like protein)